MLKICLFGPESTGKTTLARCLADHFETVWVPEFAREFLLRNGNVFTPAEVRPLADGQLLSQKAAILQANRVVFFDTDLVTNALYSQYCFGKIPAWLDEMARENLPDFYFLLDTDLPWKADELRTHGEDRSAQMALWRWGLHRYGCRFELLSGDGEARFSKAVGRVNALLGG